MAKSILIPEVTIPVGSRSFGPANVPGNVSRIALSLTRTFWTDPAIKVSVSCDVSYDSGQSWQFLGGFTAEGNASRTDVESGFDLPIAPGANRRIRGSATISGGPLKTQVNLELK